MKKIQKCKNAEFVGQNLTRIKFLIFLGALSSSRRSTSGCHDRILRTSLTESQFSCHFDGTEIVK